MKSYTWSNFWPVVVTYWGKGEPAKFAAAEGCVYMNAGKGTWDGFWTHTDCSGKMKPGICKKPLSEYRHTL